MNEKNKRNAAESQASIGATPTPKDSGCRVAALCTPRQQARAELFAHLYLPIFSTRGGEE